VSSNLDTDFFRVRLLALRDEILQVSETGDQATRTVELDQTRVGRLSRMDALQVQAMSLESKRRREIHLRQITAALKRIDDGSCGWCFDCDQPIAHKRLEFDPSTSRCIRCAEEIEK